MTLTTIDVVSFSTAAGALLMAPRRAMRAAGALLVAPRRAMRGDSR
jgi:hypothetical protein